MIRSLLRRDFICYGLCVILQIICKGRFSRKFQAVIDFRTRFLKMMSSHSLQNFSNTSGNRIEIGCIKREKSELKAAKQSYPMRKRYFWITRSLISATLLSVKPVTSHT